MKNPSPLKKKKLELIEAMQGIEEEKNLQFNSS